MNKILNWTFGACFRTLGRFLAIFIVFALLLFIGSKLDLELPSWLGLRVNAATITSYDSYKNYQNDNSSCGTSGKYSYTTTLPNVQGGNYWETGSLNTTITGQAHDIALSFNSALLANTYYDVTINFMSNDLRYNVTRDNLSLYSGSSCQDFGTNNIALVSFTNTATSSKNTNNLKLRIYSATVNNYWTILLTANNNQFLTSINNFGIKNIDLVQVEDNSTEDIINNQTNNTENIINNSNANTEKLENTIKDQFQDCRNSKNIIESYYISGHLQQYSNQLFIVFPFESNTTYTLSYDGTPGAKFYTNERVTNDVYFSNTIARTYVTFTTLENPNQYDNISGKGWVILKNNETFTTAPTFENIMLVKGSSRDSYEPPGQVCSNKLDDLNNGIGDVNNSINDLNNNINDSDITGAESSASGFFNDFTTETFGLTAIITAPLNAINSLINLSCNNLVLPLPFVDKNLTLPCMTSIYSNYFKGFFDLYQIITTGLISYYIIVRIFNLVKDFKNPEHDEIEVMDL